MEHPPAQHLFMSPQRHGDVYSSMYLSDSSGANDSDNISSRELRSIREVDAGSIVGPVISRSQTAALYAAATSPDHSPPESVAAESEDEAQDAAAEARSPEHSALGGASRHSKSFPGKKKKLELQKQRMSAFNLPNIQMPSLPNVSLPAFMTENSRFSNMMEKGRRARTYTLQFPQTHAKKEKQHSQNLKPNTGTIPPLRRASSDGSLSRRLTRMSSATSSFRGDDLKFENIHTMTNSRLKAIKDNIRAGLPTIPQLPYIQQQWSNLNFNPFTDATPQDPQTAVPRESHALDALDTLTGDVVLLGGYRGSILRNRADGKRVWVPLKVSLNLRQIDLEVPLSASADEEMDSSMYADGMLKHIGPVDIARRLLRRLQTNAHKHSRRVHDYGYDWRLAPALLVRRLISYLETLPCNQSTPPRGATVIAHSLGGLIVRAAANTRPDLFAGIIFAGTPSHCVNILGPIRNGDSVLFNSNVFTAQVNFSLRTSFVFLPESGRLFIDRATGEPLNLNFFDADVWRKYRLSPCVSDATPETGKLKDRSLAPQLRSSGAAAAQQITIPRPVALSYLRRILAETATFKKSLHFQPELKDKYPPMAVLYSKGTPTVRGARVDGWEGIMRDDVYDELVFGAGDGVCLARAAMLPEGYRAVRKVCVDRGHLSLLGDLEAVGECVKGLREARGW